MKARASASEAERVAPGYIIKFRVALKGRNTGDISALQAFTSRALSQPRGDALRFACACPWLSYLRAFGALTFLQSHSRFVSSSCFALIKLAP